MFFSFVILFNHVAKNKVDIVNMLYELASFVELRGTDSSRNRRKKEIGVVLRNIKKIGKLLGLLKYHQKY